MSLQRKLITIAKSRFLQPWIVLCIDVLASVSASAMVLILVNILIPGFAFSRSQICWWLGISLIASTVIFKLARVYKAVIRYSTLRELGRICVIVLCKEIVLWGGVIAATQLGSGSLLGGMILVDYCMTVCAMFLIRVAMVAVYEHFRPKSSAVPGFSQPVGRVNQVLIYGIDERSVALARMLSSSIHYRFLGFIVPGHSDDYELSGRTVHSFETLDDLTRIAGKAGASGILFSHVNDARSEQDRLINYCREVGLRTYVIPRIDEMNPEKGLNNYVRKIKIEDLLGRDEIKISMNEICRNFAGKVVLITGAAGSIGSELCRQIATYGVKQLILFDNAETPLHNIRLELEDRFPDLNFVPIIGDVRSNPRLDFVFRQYHPQVVFHAAAYKHVPLMEENPCEAVMVNVCGSRQVADNCVKYGVEEMIMVSTDKAVNPTNIMGCTKRLAEIYVQSLGLAIERGDIQGNTRFVTTRFGNVLGSNGSVIPRFREQIEHGGPITVTHPEITRFFMTIPEACRLVVEAATFATGTQIFVFDMGQSVKIVSLAERMIHLAGLEVGTDIKIEFTGLRPGEKLYEEVLATKENTLPTCHERIFIAKAREYSYQSAAEVADEITRLATLVTIPDMVRLMKRTVPEFKSKNSEYEKYDREQL